MTVGNNDVAPRGGLAMEYYGLRKCGNDIDFIISNQDYQILSLKYPDYKVDYWGIWA